MAGEKKEKKKLWLKCDYYTVHELTGRKLKNELANNPTIDRHTSDNLSHTVQLYVDISYVSFQRKPSVIILDKLSLEVIPDCLHLQGNHEIVRSLPH